MNQSNLRTLVVTVLLAACGLFLQFRGRMENVPQGEHLDQLPKELNGWTGTDLAISNDVLEVLGAGHFLSRAYFDKSRSDVPVGLFVAYFPSQRTGETMHSPRNCLPGSGWEFTESRRTQVRVPNVPPISANEYVIAKGAEKQLVLYWYQAHGRGIASEYWAKFYLVADAIRLNRTDGAMIRITTPFFAGEGISEPRRRANEFAADLVPQFSRFIPN